MEWNNLRPDRDQWRALVIMVMNLWVKDSSSMLRRAIGISKYYSAYIFRAKQPSGYMKGGKYD